MVRERDCDISVSSAEEDSRGTWSFDISTKPLSSEEQAVFASDLERLGTGETVWKILNGALEIGTGHSQPKLLRAYRNTTELAGAAYFIECCKVGESMFNPPISTMLDLPKLPIFVWSRYGIGTDNNANPGFVAPGIDRDEFVTRAIDALTREYIYGSLVDSVDSPIVPGGVRSVAFDNGWIDVEQFASVDDYLRRRKNLRKKLNTFRNKGGTVETVRGAMSPDDRLAVAALYGTMQPRMFTAYQDIFVPMVVRTAAIDDPGMIHIITRMNGKMVGYHSFYIGGQTLHCLSGGFDRSRKSTYHAYENLIVESVRFSLEHDLTTIHYGPALNETKAKMMTTFKTLDLRAYPRYGFMRAVLRGLMRRSILQRDEISQYRGIHESQGPASVDTRQSRSV